MNNSGKFISFLAQSHALRGIGTARKRIRSTAPVETPGQNGLAPLPPCFSTRTCAELVQLASPLSSTEASRREISFAIDLPSPSSPSLATIPTVASTSDRSLTSPASATNLALSQTIITQILSQTIIHPSQLQTHLEIYEDILAASDLEDALGRIRIWRDWWEMKRDGIGFESIDNGSVGWTTIGSPSQASTSFSRLSSSSSPASESTLQIPPVILSLLLSKRSTPSSALGMTSIIMNSTTSITRVEAMLLVKLTNLLVRYEMMAVLRMVLERFYDGIAGGSGSRHGPVTTNGATSLPTMLRSLAGLVIKRSGRGSSPEVILAGRQMIDHLTKHVLSHTISLFPTICKQLTDWRLLGRRLRYRLINHFERSGREMPRVLVRSCFEAAAREKDGKGTRRFWEVLKKGERGADAKREGEMDDLLLAWTEDRYIDILKMIDRSTVNDDKSLEWTRKAWKFLFKLVGNDDDVDLATWEKLLNRAPKDILDDETTVTMLHGMVMKGSPKEALEAWESSVKDGKLKVDAVTLRVPVRALIELGDLEGAVRLIDEWAKRPGETISPNKTIRPAQLDTRIINLIFGGCVRLGYPNVAYRIWGTMLRRYGVRQDSITLTTLLECSRYADRHSKVDKLSPSLSGIAWAIAKAFRRESVDVTLEDVVDGDDTLRNSPVEMLFDNDADRGTNILDWQTGRAIFRSIVLENWPDLRSSKSPMIMANVGSLNLFGGSVDVCHHQQQDLKSPTRQQPIPTSSRYVHIKPSPEAFHSYILLLGYRSLTSEIPLALTWMRALSIQPLRKTLIASLAYVSQNEGPARMMSVNSEDGMERRWLRDEEVLRLWLEGWLWKGAVPTEEEVELRCREEMGFSDSS